MEKPNNSPIIYTNSQGLSDNLTVTEIRNQRELASTYDKFRDPSTPFSTLVVEVDRMSSEFRNTDIVATSTIGNDVSLHDVKLALVRWLEIINNKYAENTIKSLNYDLTIYIDLCHKHQLNPFNISCREFISLSEQRRGECKPATMARWCNSVSKFYQALNIINPMQDELVKSVFIKHRKDKGGGQGQARGMTFEQLDTIYDMLSESDSLADIRDLVALSLMLECLMRRAELVSIEIQHINLESETPLLYISRSKTDQDGSDATYVPFSERTRRIIEHWLNLSGITTGYLLRGLTKYGKVRSTKPAPDLINKITKRASELLGLDVYLTGHSGRVGGIQELVADGHSNIAIQLNARLKTPAMVARYAREINAATLPMSEFLKRNK